MTRGFPADLPAGRGCPISKFSLYAVAISDPKACSVGLAVFPHIRREATPIRNPSHATRVAAFLPDGWVTSAGTSLPRGCRRTFSLAAQLEPGSYLRRDLADALPCFRLRHVHNMREANVEVVAPAYVNERG